MLKRTITYTDFNGNERTESFYFNLSKAELAEWQLREQFSGGFQEQLSEIIASKNGGVIMDTFRKIISNAYGIKSDDGRTFTKSAEISAGFLGSEAYSVLFMELIQDSAAAARFINAIVPAEFADQSVLQNNQGPRQPQDYQPKQQVKTVELPPTQPQFEQNPVQPVVPENYNQQPQQQFPMQPYTPDQPAPIQPYQPQFRVPQQPDQQG